MCHFLAFFFFFRTVLHNRNAVSFSVLGCEVQYLVLVSFFPLGPQIGTGKKHASSLGVCNSDQPLDGTNSLPTACEERDCGGFEMDK